MRIIEALISVHSIQKEEIFVFLSLDITFEKAIRKFGVKVYVQKGP